MDTPCESNIELQAENPPPRSVRATSTRNRLAVDERRAQLLKLGLELFGNHNYDELSIEGIARRAGISKGLLYHYFPSKRDYYLDVIRAAAADLLARTDPAPSEDPLERLALGIDGYLDYVQKNAQPFSSLLRRGIGFDAEVIKIVEHTRQAFLARFLDSIPDVRSPQLRNALRGWLGFAEGAVLDWLDHQDISRAELKKLLIESVLHNVNFARKSARDSRVPAQVLEPEILG